MLHIKELGPKSPTYSYLMMQRFSRPRYINQHNSHKSDTYFLIIPAYYFSTYTCIQYFVSNTPPLQYMESLTLLMNLLKQ